MLVLLLHFFLIISTDLLGWTPAYAPPELTQETAKMVSPGMDVWALGLTILETLTGTLLSYNKDEFPAKLGRAVAKLPLCVSTMIRHMLQPDPSKRLSSADLSKLSILEGWRHILNPPPEGFSANPSVDYMIPFTSALLPTVTSVLQTPVLQYLLSFSSNKAVLQLLCNVGVTERVFDLVLSPTMSVDIVRRVTMLLSVKATVDLVQSGQDAHMMAAKLCGNLLRDGYKGFTAGMHLVAHGGLPKLMALARANNLNTSTLEVLSACASHPGCCRVLYQCGLGALLHQNFDTRDNTRRHLASKVYSNCGYGSPGTDTVFLKYDVSIYSLSNC